MAAPAVRLRRITAADEALYLHLYTDPRLMRHIAPAPDEAAVRRAFASACRQAGDPSARVQLWMIEPAPGEPAEGLCALVRHPGHDDEAELGVMLVRRAQNRGLAVAALAAVADHAFAALGKARVWTRHAPANRAVVRLMRQLSFEPLVPADDGRELRYRMTSERWPAVRAGLPVAVAAMHG